MRSAVALPTIAVRADKHLSLTPGAQKQPGIVIAPPGEEGWTIRHHPAILDSEPYASADLGAASDVTAKSIQSEAASVSSPSPISLQPLNDVTPAHAVTVLCDQQHRFAGETTASQRQGARGCFRACSPPSTDSAQEGCSPNSRAFT